MRSDSMSALPRKMSMKYTSYFIRQIHHRVLCHVESAFYMARNGQGVSLTIRFFNELQVPGGIAGAACLRCMVLIQPKAPNRPTNIPLTDSNPSAGAMIPIQVWLCIGRKNGKLCCCNVDLFHVCPLRCRAPGVTARRRTANASPPSRRKTYRSETIGGGASI